MYKLFTIYCNLLFSMFGTENPTYLSFSLSDSMIKMQPVLNPRSSARFFIIFCPFNLVEHCHRAGFAIKFHLITYEYTQYSTNKVIVREVQKHKTRQQQKLYIMTKISLQIFQYLSNCESIHVVWLAYQNTSTRSSKYLLQQYTMATMTKSIQICIYCNIAHIKI